MKATVGVAALVAVLIAATGASASRPATQPESRWMSTNATVPSGQYVEWGRVSTVDPHYGIYYAKRCAAASDPCARHTRPTFAFLLRRTKLTPQSWANSILAQAQVHPPYRLARLCRAAPRRVRVDLLPSLCGR
jgi:hypothetical protein